MTEDLKTEDLKKFVKLVEITRAEKPGEGSNKKFWRITLEYRVPRTPPMLQAIWYVDPAEYTEDAVIPLARAWTHGLCASIAKSTQEWALTDDQTNALKVSAPQVRPQEKPQVKPPEKKPAS